MKRMIHTIRKNRMCFIGFPLSLVCFNIYGGVSKGVGLTEQTAGQTKINIHSINLIATAGSDVL